MTPIEAAWLSLVDRFPVSFEVFSAACEAVEVFPVVVDAELAGALLVKGAEIHACILPQFKGRWLTRKELRVMDAVIEKHGYAQTSATTAEGEYFVKRLGFEQHGDTFRRVKKWAQKS